MKFFPKKFIILIIVGIFFIAAGVFTILAVTNRGAAAVGWWKFDEGQGASAYDASGNANTGTIANATWKQEDECKFGKCLYFDGTGDNVSVTSASELNPTAGVTVEGWVRPNNFSGASTLASKPSQYALDINQGMPRFMAYANSRWYSVQDQTADSASLFHETFDGGLYEASNSFTPAFGYRALTPTNLTAKKGVLITQSDNLQYSRGSQATPDGTNVVYENFNPNQGTLEFWVRPNWDGGDSQHHRIFAENIDNNSIRFYKGSDNLFYMRIQDSVGTYHYVSKSTTTWTAGTWYHIVSAWSNLNAVNSTYLIELYVNGSTTGNSYINATDGSNEWTMANVDTLLDIGHLDGANQFNGTIAGRILNRPLSSTEVTALYNSGAGSTDTFTATPDTVWLGTYSDDATTNAYWHSGKSVSAISDGATEDTITTATGADTSFKDNDRVVVSDGTGYSSNAIGNTFVDGTPSATSLAVDNGAGADTGALEKIGRNLDLNATYYAQAANSGVHDITTEDISISAWVKVDVDAGASARQIFEKKNVSDEGFHLYVTAAAYFGIDDGGGDPYVIYSNTDLRDNKWHYISVIIDRDNEANCKVFIDGYEDGSTNKTGTLADIGSLTNTHILQLGRRDTGTSFFDGQVRDVKLYYADGDHWTDEQILYQAQHPFDYSANAGSLTDYWRLDEGTGTTLTGFANNLTGQGTNFATLAWSQEAFVSKNLIADGGMESGGIGAWVSGDSASTLSKNTTAANIKFDAQSLRITNGDATQAFARQTIKTTANGNYVFNGWFKAPTTPDANSQLVNVGSDPSLGITVAQAGATSAGTWYEVNFAFKAAGAEATIDLGSGSVTNGQIGYWDNVSIMPNLVDNGGMETGGTVDVDLPTGWTTRGTPTSIFKANTSSNSSTGKVHSGTYSVYVNADANDEGVLSDTFNVTVGKYYTASAWVYVVSGSVRLETSNQLGYASVRTSTTGQWVKLNWTSKATVTGIPVVFVSSYGGAATFYVDDVSVIELDTLSASTATPSTQANSFGTGKWGESNGAFLVDGGDTLTYPTSGNISAQQGTISMWVKPQVLSTTRNLFSAYTSANDHLTLSLNSSNYPVLSRGSSTVTGTTALSSPTTWYHLTGTWTNGGNLTLYVNSASQGTPIAYTAITLPANFQLGSQNSLAQGDAFLDDVRIYDTVLSPTDISSLYNNSYNNSIATNQWAHLAGVYSKSGQNLKIYVDGVLKNTYSIGSSYDLGTGSSALTIGDGLTGYLDDVRVYPEARSASQIKADFTGQGDPVPKGTAVKSSVTVGQSQDSSEGLVAYYKFDETALNQCGTAQDACDSSGNLNHLAAIADAAPTSTAKFGYAATFDGTGDYYCSDPDNDGACEDDDDLSFGNGTTDQPFTIEAWVKMTDATSQRIIQKGTLNSGFGEYGFTTRSGDQIAFFTYDESVDNCYIGRTYNTALTSYEGQWVHLVGVYNGNSRSSGFLIYLNGARVDDTNYEGNPSLYVAMENGTDTFRIGNDGVGGSYFTGQIDDVKIYKVARTAEQIRRDYESGPPPVAHWKMDENTGQYAYDTSGNANNGTLGSASSPDTADPSWTSGKYGSALKFDGTDDYVDITKFRLTERLSISAWVNVNSSATLKTIFDARRSSDGGDEIAFYISSVNKITALAVNSAGSTCWSVTGNTTLTNNKWYNVALKSDGSNVYVFLNGVQDGSGSVSGVIDTNNNPSTTWYVGRAHYDPSNNRWMNGLIDDVRIYNYARTQKQILEDMLGSPKLISGGGNAGGAVAYWSFDEGAGDTAYDKSVNNNDGNLAGTCPGDATCPTWTTNGKFGKALSFDGSDDYVDVADRDLFSFGSGSAGTDKPFSISVWFNNSAVGSSNKGIVAKATGSSGGEYYLLIDTSQRVFFGLVDDSAAAYIRRYTPALTLNTWYHVVGIYDGSGSSSGLSIYVNGVRVDDNTSDSGSYIAMENTSNNLTIGKRTTNLFPGLIDEVKIYPFALSPAEIKEEFNRGASLKLGSAGGGSSLATSSDSALLEYCVPGSSDYCASPVAHWRLDEKTGQYGYDTSGNSNTGTLGSGATADSADPTWKSASACHTGACLSFDGTDDYVSAGDPASGVLDFGTGSFSISLWAKTSTLSGQKTALSKQETIVAGQKGFWIMIPASDNHYYIQVKGTGGTIAVQSATTIDTNWHNYTFVIDRSANIVKLYKDGVVDANTSNPSAIGNIDNAVNFLIGDWRQSATEWFNGLIDDVRIYNYARTAAQVAWDYNRGKPVAHWKMDDGWNTATTCDGTGTTVKDASGRGNTGTLTLGATPTPAAAWSEGKYACGITFDGTDDYVSMGDVLDVDRTNPFTLSAWIKRNSDPNTFMDIIGKQNSGSPYQGYTMGVSGGVVGDPIEFELINSYSDNYIMVRGSSGITVQQWYHVVATYDGSSQASGVKLYVNGRADSLTIVGNSLSATTITSYSLQIGARNTTAFPFPGIIDDVRIYNYALNATQIKTLFNENAAVRFGPTEGLP